MLNSRANYGRVKRLLLILKKNKNVDLKIVLGASSLLYKFGDISSQIKKDGLIISEKFYSIVEGENLLTMTKSSGLTIIELSNIFKKNKTRRSCCFG